MANGFGSLPSFASGGDQSTISPALQAWLQDQQLQAQAAPAAPAVPAAVDSGLTQRGLPTMSSVLNGMVNGASGDMQAVGGMGSRIGSLLGDMVGRTGDLVGKFRDGSISPTEFLGAAAGRAKDAASSAFTAPRDAYTGDLQVFGPDGHPTAEAMDRANGLAGLAMTGGIGGTGAGGSVLGSTASRGAKDITALRQVLEADHPNINQYVTQRDGGPVIVNKVVVPPEMRGQGAGTSFMRDVLDYADANGVPAALTPSTDFGGKIGGLRGWYSSLGFVPNKGRARDFSTSESMIRPPNKGVTLGSGATDELGAAATGGAVMVGHPIGGSSLDDLLASMGSAIDQHAGSAVPDVRPMNRVNPKAASWDLYHGTDAPTDFARFDTNLPKAQRGHTPDSELGGLFLSPAADEAAQYSGSIGGRAGAEAGPRVIRTTVDPGRTDLFDLPHLMENDPAFVARARQAVIDENPGNARAGAMFDERHARMLDEFRSARDLNKQLTDLGYPATEVPQVQWGYGATGAAMQMARERGLDTAVLRGLSESNGGDQVVALTPGRVRSYYDPSQVLYSGGKGGAPVGAAVLSASGERAPIRAYHGSPHDFDTFDISKIGTGEGNQSYGHGLYFAGNEATAQHYRDALTPKKEYLVGDLPLFNEPLGAGERVTFNEIVGNSRPKTTGKLADLLNTMGSSYHPEARPLARAILDAHGADAPLSVRKALPGHMYEVGIDADPTKMLNWDAPLSAQPRTVQDIGHSAIEHALRSGEFDRPPAGPTGASVYKALQITSPKNGAASAATALRDAGVPGLQYLDQMSRRIGTGTSNTVTFSDDIVKILRKYGLAGLIGGGAAASALGQNKSEGM